MVLQRRLLIDLIMPYAQLGTRLHLISSVTRMQEIIVNSIISLASLSLDRSSNVQCQVSQIKDLQSKFCSCTNATNRSDFKQTQVALFIYLFIYLSSHFSLFLRYIGATVLFLSKIFMYNFHYNVMKRHFPKSTVIMTDTG